ncbi:dienelactone hydrolase family protein [Talaromyces stipitatus ATCC 10500]|uniref:Dienelactone hydrolase family protein n=1 Tax=Talaromyces stipitatus (strain ATCC 10500 / CBS 375.48 / QM 6759 / NRRL 1006) TaxID=441959 RepID=B8MTD6_TALSN|nr:dienelactone hydrolase family protein [Talaromyces stipitatus ATCC 10500]EED12181.1 dienelactone hydrolase family protein [Talaromyces stipitatus ATCC 10500]
MNSDMQATLYGDIDTESGYISPNPLGTLRNPSISNASGFEWDGTPTGQTGKLANTDIYIAGDSTASDIAILFIADMFGWTFKNNRLLADQIAREVGATVYLPDFFAGEVIDSELIANEQWDKVDLAGFMSRHGRQVRESEIFECAKALRQQYKKLGAVGHCYGGWASFRLGAKSTKLVDVISVGHPSLLTKEDIDGIAVPVQVLAPEIDPVYSPELKLYTFQTVPTLGVPFDYQHFPGVVHGCLVRGDETKSGERLAMIRGKNALVAWMSQFLKE